MKIVTDSAADIPVDEIASLGITVAPLYITFPDRTVSSADITPDEFYNQLERLAPRIPTTSQPSQGSFLDIYNELAKFGEEILAIHVSSGLSGTIQSSRLAAKEITKPLISVVDSMTLSGGERFQVIAAVAAAKAGWATSKIISMLKGLQQKTEVIYTLETLDYLARGGRIGRVEALAGSLLKIKPVINVNKDDGKYSTVGKARTLQRAQGMIGDHLATVYGDVPVWVCVLHGRFEAQAEALAALLRERLRCAKLEILRISPVLGVHTGPGIVGAAVVPMSLMTEAGVA